MRPKFPPFSLITPGTVCSRSILVFALIAVGSTPVLSQAATNTTPALVTRVGGTLSAVGIAVSPDGKWFASEAQDGAVTIWSTTDGSEYRTFQAFNAYSQLASAGHLAVASDAATVVVLAGADVHVVDVRTARELRKFPVSSAQWDTWQIASNPKSMTAAVITQSGNVSVFSLVNGQQLFHASFQPLANPAGPIALHVAFSPDGRFLAIVTDQSFQLWDWAANHMLLNLDARKFHKSSSPAVAPVSADGGSIQLAASVPPYFFTGASFSPDGKRIALTSHDELNILNLPSGSRAQFSAISPGLAPGCIFATDDLIFLPQGNLDASIFSLAKGMLGSAKNVNLQDYVAVPGHDRGILLSGVPYLFQASTFSVVNAMFAKARPPQSLTFTPDMAQLLVGTFFKPFASWSLDSGEALAFPDATDVTSPAISGNGKYLASADPIQKRIRVFTLGSKLNEFQIPVPIHNLNTSISSSASGEILGLTQQSGDVNLISVPQKKVIATLTADHPSSIAIEPDGSQFALADRAGTTIYSVAASPSKITALPVDDPNHYFKNNSPNVVRFSPDGKWLAIMETSELRLISTQTWSEVRKFGGVGGLCTEFSPDSRLLAMPMQSQGVEIVDISSGAVIFQDKEHLTSCPIAFNRDATIFAAATQYGTELHSTSDGHLLATLYLFSDETHIEKQLLDWLVVTPDGLFDGTPGAWGQLAWRFTNDTFDVAPIEIFFQNFYHPGLLAEIAAGNALHAPADIASIDRRQPEVGLSGVGSSGPVASRKVGISLSVTQAASDKAHSTPSGARDLRLFRNGTLVEAWRGEIKLDSSGTAHLSVEVPIVAGENHFTAYAFNDAGIKSSDATLTVTGADSLERRGTAWVVSMGIDHYAAGTAENHLDLNFAESDASDFAAQFTRDQQQLQQFAQVRRIDLLGGSATKANLQAAFHLLSGGSPDSLDAAQKQLFAGVTAVQPEDGVFLFYAGHGAALDNHFYLIPQDFDPKPPLQDARSHTVSDAELSRMLEGISPARSFLIIDACNSGQVVDPKVPVGPTDATGLAELAYEKGLYILAASKNSEPALETHELGSGHGFLTYALVDEGLRAGDAAQKGVVELRPWFIYASRRVPEMQANQLERRTLRPDGATPDTEARQHPRIFYRREPESNPFIVGKTQSAISSTQ